MPFTNAEKDMTKNMEITNMHNKDQLSITPIIHLMIIWSEGLNQKDNILKDLRQQFDIIKTFKITWDKKLFEKNLMVFYSHSLQYCTHNHFKSIIKSKKKHCGCGHFCAIVFKDPQPVYERRETTNGIRTVNAHAFDNKQKYRLWTGGGHKVHCSDNAWETNKDLTLLFGLNTDDFCRKYEATSHADSFSEEKITRNCMGVGGYADICDLFYVLNNTINYVVLRNHECLPTKYMIEGHGDIDLLVENKNYIAYLTEAIPIKYLKYRVCYTINIGRIKVPFDFRYVGDNYYDVSWEQDILNKRVLLNKGIYIPDSENQFYTLLYHAYIQKREIRNDYLPKLQQYGKCIGVAFDPNTDKAISLLDSYLAEKKYEYIRPSDKSVYYHQKNLSRSNWAFRHGICVKRIESRDDDPIRYHAILFKTMHSYIKVGSSWLINNEAYYLGDLYNKLNVPKLLRHESVGNTDDSLLEIAIVPGLNMAQLLHQAQFYTSNNLRLFVKQSIETLITLKKNDIAHRDFQLSNLMLDIYSDKKSFHVIDFGWACLFNNISENRPITLTSKYSKTPEDTDFIVFSRVLKENLGRFQYVRRIISILDSMNKEEVDNSEYLDRQIRMLKDAIISPMELSDRFLLLAYRCHLNRIYRFCLLLSGDYRYTIHEIIDLIKLYYNAVKWKIRKNLLF